MKWGEFGDTSMDLAVDALFGWGYLLNYFRVCSSSPLVGKTKELTAILLIEASDLKRPLLFLLALIRHWRHWGKEEGNENCRWFWWWALVAYGPLEVGRRWRRWLVVDWRSVRRVQWETSGSNAKQRVDEATERGRRAQLMSATAAFCVCVCVGARVTGRLCYSGWLCVAFFCSCGR